MNFPVLILSGLPRFARNDEDGLASLNVGDEVASLNGRGGAVACNDEDGLLRVFERIR